MSGEFAVFGKTGKLVKVSQEGYEKENMFPASDEFGKRRGGDKIPFAFNHNNEEISVEDGEKYYFSSKYVIEKPVKLGRHNKYICSSFMRQIFYLYGQEDSTKQILNTIEQALLINFSIIFEPSPTYICPSCNRELVFYNIKKDRNNKLPNYFRHKEPFPVSYRITEEVIGKSKSFKRYLSYEEKLKALEPLLNIDCTKTELTKKLQEIKIIKDNTEDMVSQVDTLHILPNIARVYKGHCNFIWETEKHLRAKWKVAELIKSGSNMNLLRSCSLCGCRDNQILSTKDRKVFPDYKLSEEHRADIAVLDSEEKLLAVIEIADEIEVDSYKEKALDGIYWAELTAETILGSNQWLVKRDHFKPFICKKCRIKQGDFFPETIPEISPVKIEQPVEGRVKLESENYFFYLNLLLKEEFRVSSEMTDLVVKELDSFFGFKTTEILTFNKDGSKKEIYKYDYSEKLPPDKDTMWVLSFKLNEKHWVNILDYPQPVPEMPGYVKCVKFKDAMAEKGKALYFQGIKAVDTDDVRAEFFELLSRFFYVKNNEKISSLIYFKSVFNKSSSNKYRKKQRKTYNYSIPHQNAYGSEIEKLLGEAMRKENIKFVKQYEVYVNKKLFTVPDFYIEEGKIVIYCDGFKYHYNKESVIRDRCQDRVLQYMDYEVLRFTGSEIVGNIEQCIFDIKRFIRKGAGGK